MSVEITHFSSATVYIWHGTSSNKNVSAIPMPSFGHVALETKLGNVSRYISFWPGNCDSVVCSQKEPHYHSKEIDRIYEGRPAFQLPMLKSLNIEKINDWFDANKDDFSWVLRGSSILKGSNEFNCAGLTYRLLKEGGIQEIMPTHFRRNIRRIAAAVSTSCCIFTPLCFWSSYIMRPISQFPAVVSSVMVEIMNIEDAALRAFATLKNMYEHILLASQAAKQMYYLELNGYQHLKDAVFPIVDAMASTDAISNVFDIIPANSHLGYKAPILKNLLLIDFGRYTPFLTLGGIVALSTLAFGIGMAFLSNKVIVDVITPADVEDLVLRASEQEKLKIDRKAETSSLLRGSLKWVICALGVSSMAYYFFKDTFSFREALKVQLLS